MKKITLGVFLFSLCLLYGCGAPLPSEARFQLTALQTNPGANLMEEISFEFPFGSAVVMNGAYTGIEFNFSTQVGEETRELTFYLPGVEGFNVWETWDSGETQFEYQMYETPPNKPFILTQDNFSEAWDSRNERPVQAYIRFTRTTPTDSDSSDVIYYNFPTFELTIQSFSIKDDRIFVEMEFHGQMDESSLPYSGALYDISGAFAIHDASLGIMDID